MTTTAPTIKKDGSMQQALQATSLELEAFLISLEGVSGLVLVLTARNKTTGQTKKSGPRHNSLRKSF